MNVTSISSVPLVLVFIPDYAKTSCKMPMLERFRRKLSRSSVSDRRNSKTSFDDGTVEVERIMSKLSMSAVEERTEPKLAFEGRDHAKTAPGLRTVTPSIATHGTGWSERTVCNNTETGFLALPDELCLHLQPYLGRSAEVALRQTNSRFFHLFSSPSFYLSADDKFDFLCMLERDADQDKLTKFVCGKCHDFHPRNLFTKEELTKPPLERDCRQVWLCPHKAIDYEKCRKRMASIESEFRVETIDPCGRCRESIRSRSVADRPEKRLVSSGCDEEPQSMLVTKVALLQAPSPSHATKGMASSLVTETFPAKAVSDALQALNFRICPHIQLGDPYILSRFCRACLRTTILPPGQKGLPCIQESKGDDPRKSGKCKGVCFDRRCKTKFMFQARESLTADASGQRQVWLIMAIYRWLGPLDRDSRSSTWLEHTVLATERQEMRVAWDKWLKDGPRKCMPNWSICVLHAEDSNLR